MYNLGYDYNYNNDNKNYCEGYHPPWSKWRMITQKKEVETMVHCAHALA